MTSEDISREGPPALQKRVADANRTVNRRAAKEKGQVSSGCTGMRHIDIYNILWLISLCPCIDERHIDGGVRLAGSGSVSF